MFMNVSSAFAGGTFWPEWWVSCLPGTELIAFSLEDDGLPLFAFCAGVPWFIESQVAATPEEFLTHISAFIRDERSRHYWMLVEASYATVERNVFMFLYRA